MNKKHNFCRYPVSYRIDFSSLSNSTDIINRAEVVIDSDNATFMKKKLREKKRRKDMTSYDFFAEKITQASLRNCLHNSGLVEK